MGLCGQKRGDTISAFKPCSVLWFLEDSWKVQFSPFLACKVPGIPFPTLKNNTDSGDEDEDGGGGGGGDGSVVSGGRDNDDDKYNT